MKSLLHSAPSTTDLTALEGYRLVRQEVAKLDSPNGETVNWQEVGAQATALLACGQDILVAVYAAAADIECNGATHIPAALRFVAGFLERFWSTMTPPLQRLRGRVNAMEWFAQWLERRCSVRQETLPDDVLESFEAFATAVREAYGNHAPSLRALKKQLVIVPAPDVPVTHDAKEEAPQPASVPAPAAPSDLSARGLGKDLSALAHTLRAADSCNPEAYRLLRAGRWLSITLPPAPLGDVTRVPPLPEALRAGLESAQSQQQWATLRDSCEEAFERYPLHLDLQSYSFSALTALGNTDAARAVLLETRAFVARLPTLPELRASDGTPLAAESTRQWLQPVKPERAAASDGASGRRAWFCTRLTQAEEAFRSDGHAAVGLALYEQLLQTMQRHRLASWEPELSKRLLMGYIAGLRVAPSDGSQQIHSMVQRLARLDPDAAMRAARGETG